MFNLIWGNIQYKLKYSIVGRVTRFDGHSGYNQFMRACMGIVIEKVLFDSFVRYIGWDFMPLSKEYYSGDRQEMLDLLPDNYTRVLEIGCGDGGFSQYLDKATEIWGIEPSETVKFPFFRVLKCTYDEAYSDLPDNYFDLVICNDVIEHLPNTDQFLQTIKDKMEPSGVLIGSIPNVRYYRNLRSLIFSGQWEYTDSGILDRTHLRFFTEKSLLGTFSRNQMKIERFERINRVKGFKVFIFFLNLITFNRCSDTRYLQFAFRISKN